MLLLHRGPSARALRLCSPSTYCYHTESRALRPDEKLHAPVHVPPRSEVFSRQQGEQGGRREEQLGEEREGRGSTQTSKLSDIPCLLAGVRYQFFAVYDLECYPVSSQSLPPYEPPSQTGCPSMVLYYYVEISVRTHHHER